MDCCRTDGGRPARKRRQRFLPPRRLQQNSWLDKLGGNGVLCFPRTFRVTTLLALSLSLSSLSLSFLPLSICNISWSGQPVGGCYLGIPLMRLPFPIWGVCRYLLFLYPVAYSGSPHSCSFETANAQMWLDEAKLEEIRQDSQMRERNWKYKAFGNGL